MGSGSKRKASDFASVSSETKTTATNSLGGGMATAQAGEEKINPNTCPVSFMVKLPSKPKLVKDVKLSLKIIGQNMTIYAGIVYIANLPAKLNNTIRRCVRSGVRYSGIVVVKNLELYGSFRRTT